MHNHLSAFCMTTTTTTAYLRIPAEAHPRPFLLPRPAPGSAGRPAAASLPQPSSAHPFGGAAPALSPHAWAAAPGDGGPAGTETWAPAVCHDMAAGAASPPACTAPARRGRGRPPQPAGPRAWLEACRHSLCSVVDRARGKFRGERHAALFLCMFV